MKSGYGETIAWHTVRPTRQRNVHLPTDGLWAMPLNTRCFFYIGGMAFFDFHPLSPIATPFHTFLLMDTHTLVWHLELG